MSGVPQLNEKKRKAIAQAAGKAVEAGKEVEKEEGFWPGDGGFTPTMEGAYKMRGNMLLDSAEGKASVHRKILENAPAIAVMFGMDRVDLIPHGEYMVDMIRKGLEMAAAQMMANSEVLNRGYGPHPEPNETKTPEKSVQPDADGLLPPGSTPESAVDVDTAEFETGKQARLKAGIAYEAKLRVFNDVCRKLHVNDPRYRFCVLARRILWSCKLHAWANGNVWDVFSHRIHPVLSSASTNSYLFPGTIVQCLLPEDIGLDKECTTGLDSSVSVPGWLSSDLIEAGFLHSYPAQPKAGVVYLGIADTLLLDPLVSGFLKDNTDNPLEMSMKALVQYKRDHKGTVPEEVLRRHFEAALELPPTTTRVFWFCNPSGNHWIVVSADAVQGSKTGLFTIYDSLCRPLDRHLEVFRQYLTILSAIPGSPFAGHDWRHADIEAGYCGVQENSSDCGIFALENLSRIITGTELEDNVFSDHPPLDRRYAWFESITELIEKSTKFKVDEVDGVKKATTPKASILVQDMLKPWTLQHWQYMLIRARSDLTDDFEGQRLQLDRIYPSILAGVKQLGAFGQVTMPHHNYQSVPAVALGLNDHDIAFAQPRSSRIPDAVFVVMRSSRAAHYANGAATHGRLIGKDWCNRFYPGIDSLPDPQVITVVYSSVSPFLRMGCTKGSFVTAKGTNPIDHTTSSMKIFFDTMEQLDATPVEHGCDRKLVVILQAGFDGCTSFAPSLSRPSEWFPNLDFHLGIYSRFSSREKQPFDSAATRYGDCSWAHYDMNLLASRATAMNFQGLGPHLDSHNQCAYLLEQINALKIDKAGSSTSTVFNFPIASFLSGPYTRLYQTRLEPLWGIEEEDNFVHNSATKVTTKRHLAVVSAPLPKKKQKPATPRRNLRAVEFVPLRPKAEVDTSDYPVPSIATTPWQNPETILFLAS